MSLRIVNLIINAYGGPGAPLLRSLTDATPADPQVWVLRDKFKLRVWLRQVGPSYSSTQTPVQIDSGDQLIVGGRSINDIDASAPLFSVSGFTEHQQGSDYYYEAVLDLNTQPLIDEFQLGDTELRCLVDVKNEAADASELITLPQFIVTVRKAGYRTTDTPASSGSLPYPAPETLALRTVAGGYRIKDDGSLQIWNPDQNLFFTLGIRGTAGAEVLTVEEPGEA